MKQTLLLLLILSTNLLSQIESDKVDSILMNRAYLLAHKILILDTHIDLPDWLYDKWFDVSVKSEKGEFDFERAIGGGLNVAFMSIYTAPKLEAEGKSKTKADSLIKLVEKLEQLWPDKFKIVRNVSEIRNQKTDDQIILAIGMENGSPIEGNLDNLREFYTK